MGPKKDPMAPILVHEDVFLRGRKFIELKIVPPPAKGELTEQELCISPSFHSLPELKPAVQFYMQQSCLKLTDDKRVEPSRVGRTSSDINLAPRPRKECVENFKMFKTQVKQAEKRSAQFLKQLEKSEAKQAKRMAQIEKIDTLEKAMNDELKEARTYSERQELFVPKYMNGSKFGEKCPRKNVWIVAEATALTGPFVANIIDEITKFIQTCVEENCQCFNLAVFGAEGTWMQWCPTFQSPQDPKKGAADSIKWINKQFTAKVCGANDFPPDWVQMFEKCFEEGRANPKLEPSTIFVACSRPPEDKEAVFAAMEGKGVPIQALAFDEAMEDDAECKRFFADLCGDKGGMLVDTSCRDLLYVDKLLNNVKTKKKQLEKLQNQLLKMEDLTDVVQANKELLAQQICLENLVKNEFEVSEKDLLNADLQRDMDGNLVLPESVQSSMTKLGKKVTC
ncbi:unnamed protein product [Amoebophrya sp. A120]|nr:unnamed protein product [Amoebophrya sp. A120]|eukprot:GSA120T00015393001.1